MGASTTTVTAPTVSTTAATNLTLFQATVGGTLSSDGATTSYYVEYGTTTAYGSATATRTAGATASGLSVNFTLSGLTPGATYHYQLVASNSAGTTKGGDQSFATVAPSAPTASTTAATGLTQYQATVGGTLSSNGATTSYYVEYGTTTAYGSQSATRTAGPHQAGLSVSFTLSGLTPGDTYHYQLVTTNSAGTTNGGDQSFATVAPSAPTVSTTAASNVTLFQATVGGTLSSNGATTSYYVEYGATTAYGSQTPTRTAGPHQSALDVSFTLSSLTPGDTYHYQLVATNSAGTTNGGDQSFATVAPSAPTVSTTAAGGVTQFQAMVGGTLSSHGAATSYYVEYGTTTTYGSETGTRTAGPHQAGLSVTFTLSGLTPGDTYHYQLVATNSAGTTGGGDQTFTTVAASAPTLTTGPASNLTHFQATITGTLSSNGATTSYYVEYGATTAYGSQTATRTAGPHQAGLSLSFTLFGLTPGDTYHYQLVATNSAGTTNGGDQSFATVAPSAPTVSTGAASTVSEHAATLAGTLSSNGATTSYYIEYGTTAAYGSHTATRTAGPHQAGLSVSFTLSGLTPGDEVVP